MDEEKNITALCRAVEKTVGHALTTASHYESLSQAIFQHQHVTLSTSTLKRLWGYAGQQAHPRPFTLDTLSRFAGYRDFAAFCTSTESGSDQQSQLFIANALTADSLEPGARLLLTWQPDRRCTIEHLGESRFRVTEVENTKLSVGDTFECHLFINHEPLYVDRLIHNGLPPIGYVAGRRDGIMVRQL